MTILREILKTIAILAQNPAVFRAVQLASTTIRLGAAHQHMVRIRFRLLRIKKMDLISEYRLPNGRCDGIRLYLHKNRKPHHASYFINGKLHGCQVRWYTSGHILARTTYINGNVHGDHTIWHTSGRPYIQCIWRNGKLHGKYIISYENGMPDDIYEYINGRRCAFTT